MMTRHDFQEICNLASTTAKVHLVRLRKDRKLINVGLRNQLIYMPVPGYYGVSKDEEHPKW
ncbi:DNA-binding protein [Bacteroides sp.]|uniref:DNA-binding protein n=1 Tax=Bacteroides sp. TaxID=29523 RepID=UPI002625677C|nr:DNA-binding protein [Bacteroides sp.]MDD3036318.1 DNA-binding protein [Bacteroides sp.]